MLVLSTLALCSELPRDEPEQDTEVKRAARAMADELLTGMDKGAERDARSAIFQKQLAKEVVENLQNFLVALFKYRPELKPPGTGFGWICNGRK